MSYDTEYFCPQCGSILNQQPGFDPDSGNWICRECGQALYGDNIYEGDRYPGIMWYCDRCGALLNKQYGFYDACESWACEECGYINSISEEEIYDSEEDYQASRSDNTYDDDNDDDDDDSDYDDDDDDSDYDDNDDYIQIDHSSSSDGCLKGCLKGCLIPLVVGLLVLFGLFKILAILF